MSTTIKEEFEAIMEAHEERLAALGKRVREEVVIPACKKYGLSFFSGGGWPWFFSGPNGHISLIEEALEEGFPMHEEFKVLRLEVDKYTDIGDYVETYRLETHDS